MVIAVLLQTEINCHQLNFRIYIFTASYNVGQSSCKKLVTGMVVLYLHEILLKIQILNVYYLNLLVSSRILTGS